MLLDALRRNVSQPYSPLMPTVVSQLSDDINSEDDGETQRDDTKEGMPPRWRSGEK